MSQQLAKYDEACRAVAEAKTASEAKDIADKADAMRVYARQAKNKQMEIDAAEIRIRAERRLGEIIKAQKETVGLNKGAAAGGTKEGPRGAYVEPRDTAPTLAEAGIDKKLSSRAQKLAAVPEDKFEGMVGEWQGRVEKENERVTVNLLREGKRQQQKEEHEGLAKNEVSGEYDVIVIDPPWPVGKIDRDERPNQTGFDYPVMSVPEIEALDIPVASDCHLFCWTTQKFLPDAIECLRAWGAKYVLTMVWHKPGGFQPFNLPQYNCEFVVYGRFGAPSFVDTKAFPTCFEAPRREHSRKPDHFYELISRVTDGRRLDMFSREGRAGFDGWGNQTDKFNG